MVAEAAADGSYACWWAKDPAQRSVPFDVGARMAALLSEQGIGVADAATVPPEPLAPPSPGAVFPVSGVLLAAAHRAEAAFVVMGRAAVKPAAAPAGATVAQMQCDIQAEVLDVRTGEMLLHSSASALGVHIDREAAAQDAVTKACSRIVEYIFDRMPDASRSSAR